MLLKIGGYTTALAAIGAVLAWLGTFIAWSSDIHKLNKVQADNAVELYRGKVRGLLVIPQPPNEPAASIWREEIDNARRERDAAEKRQIELSR